MIGSGRGVGTSRSGPPHCSFHLFSYTVYYLFIFVFVCCVRMYLYASDPQTNAITFRLITTHGGFYAHTELIILYTFSNLTPLRRIHVPIRFVGPAKTSSTETKYLRGFGGGDGGGIIIMGANSIRRLFVVTPPIWSEQ